LARTMVIGHQGCDGLRPGNTLPAFAHAILLGADGVECDVHLSLDGRLAVIHDDRVDRTTDGHGAVAAMTMAELRALDAGGDRIPELDEVLELVGGRAHLVVELKAPGTAGPAVAAVRARRMLEAVTFISFRLHLLQEVRAGAPGARTGALFSRPAPEDVAAARRAGADVLDVEHRAAGPAVREAARAANMPLWLWTPDGEDELRAALALEPAAITTNRPDRLRALLA
jgi:glycerophosphoryl diester phosphodiesterase